MKHVIFGGDGFVGRHLAHKLVQEGQEVLVADVAKSDLPHYARARFVHCDVTKEEDVMKVEIGPDDMVYNMAAKMLSPLQIRSKRWEFFWPVNYYGAENIMKATARSGANRLVQFTTDMIYGHTVQSPQTEDHPAKPLGEYGKSKWATEQLAAEWRKQGMKITIFRPRLIIGPGRLGILEKLFKLIDANLPVPMIGSGKAPYQFISVFDCAEAAYLAWRGGVPNEAYNLGSDNPPSVRKLLGDLIVHAGSKSFLIPTPGFAVKATLAAFDAINLPIMDPEQYLIADEMCVRETGKLKRDLGWKAQYKDGDMLIAAYDEYRAKKAGHVAAAPSAVPAE
ncbi:MULTISPECIES: NAD(P)-dependent oxidoreductase [unclassified Rhizobium]|uniref:NAD-dependent epimerase/dehydratase family protein n=1 Tax=unclassified Rhizobium TaxID=2613769 RepID=UPI0006F8CFA1|nr:MULTISPECIES: NAD(P)-dependent oxidoreductase [unclassified Rhizobium]KQV42515.1 NAD-dependent dehydratase [Rhizobium sp. Root1212]KRD21454.1 NAD-dependent dehydratase [Rhizobium sp. Root268]